MDPLGQSSFKESEEALLFVKFDFVSEMRKKDDISSSMVSLSLDLKFYTNMVDIAVNVGLSRVLNS